MCACSSSRCWASWGGSNKKKSNQTKRRVGILRKSKSKDTNNNSTKGNGANNHHKNNELSLIETEEEQPSLSPTTSSLPTMLPTPIPTFNEVQHDFLDYLISLSSDNGTALLDRTTPQFQAFDWIATTSMTSSATSASTVVAPSRRALAERWAMTALFIMMAGSFRRHLLKKVLMYSF